MLRIKQVNLVQQGTSDDATPVMPGRSHHVQDKGGLCSPICRSDEEVGDRSNLDYTLSVAMHVSHAMIRAFRRGPCTLQK